MNDIKIVEHNLRDILSYSALLSPCGSKCCSHDELVDFERQLVNSFRICIPQDISKEDFKEILFNSGLNFIEKNLVTSLDAVAKEIVLGAEPINLFNKEISNFELKLLTEKVIGELFDSGFFVKLNSQDLIDTDNSDGENSEISKIRIRKISKIILQKYSEFSLLNILNSDLSDKYFFSKISELENLSFDFDLFKEIFGAVMAVKNTLLVSGFLHKYIYYEKALDILNDIHFVATKLKFKKLLIIETSPLSQLEIEFINKISKFVEVEIHSIPSDAIKRAHGFLSAAIRSSGSENNGNAVGKSDAFDMSEISLTNIHVEPEATEYLFSAISNDIKNGIEANKIAVILSESVADDFTLKIAKLGIPVSGPLAPAVGESGDIFLDKVDNTNESFKIFLMPLRLYIEGFPKKETIQYFKAIQKIIDIDIESIESEINKYNGTLTALTLKIKEMQNAFDKATNFKEIFSSLNDINLALIKKTKQASENRGETIVNMLEVLQSVFLKILNGNEACVDLQNKSASYALSLLDEYIASETIVMHGMGHFQNGVRFYKEGQVNILPSTKLYYYGGKNKSLIKRDFLFNDRVKSSFQNIIHMPYSFDSAENEKVLFNQNLMSAQNVNIIYANYDSKGEDIEFLPWVFQLIDTNKDKISIYSSKINENAKLYSENFNSIINVKVIENKNSKFNVSKLDKYIKCPYSYFANFVLGLRKWQEPDLEAQNVDYGNIFHKVLCDFFESKNAIVELKNSLENGLGIAFSLLEDHFEKYKFQYWDIDEKARVNLLNEIKTCLKQFLIREREYLHDANKLQEFHTEMDFDGILASNGLFYADNEISKIPFECNKVYINGQIDRIDEFESEINVIDYKTGQIPTLKSTVQLPLYSLIGSQLIGKEVTEGYYISLKDFSEKRKQKPLKKDKDKLFLAIEETVKKVFEVKEKLIAGSFNVEPQSNSVCEYCPYYKVCKIKDEYIAQNESGDGSESTSESEGA